MRGFFLAVDLEHGAIDPADGDLRLVADARLDNRQELIDALDPEGGKSVSDASLILAAYRCWGDRCPEHLLGDFAFAVWDASRHRILCAVDPLGVKPLHWARQGDRFWFASDALGVLRDLSLPRTLDETVLSDYLANRLEDSHRSFFRAVHRLSPGHRLVAMSGVERLERYWDPAPEPIRYRRKQEYALHFSELLERSVADRLRTDGPWIGIAMSGGLDSSSVAALARRNLERNGGPRLLASSFVFPQHPECDEQVYLESLRHELDLEVERINFEQFWSLDGAEDSFRDVDTPFTGWRSCYGELLRRLAVRGGRVLLMGHGADDLLRGSTLAGLDRLRRGDLSILTQIVRAARSRGQSVPRALYRVLGKPLLPSGAARLLRQPTLQAPPWLLPDFVRRTGLEKRLDTPRQFGGAREEIYSNTVGTAWYSRIVHWHDRNASRYGIEVRHPFLDRRLFELVLAFPPEEIWEPSASKSLLRRAMVGVLPEVVRGRKTKTRFISFLDFVLREKEADRIEELLGAPLAGDMGILDRDRLLAAYREYRRGGSPALRAPLWHAVTLEIWLKRIQHNVVRNVLPGNLVANSEVAA
jgi:asparagine synthase (glutamine-hydrolysing)